MAENHAPATANPGSNVPGQPFYEKSRQHLKELLHRKRLLERNLASQEEAIYQKETEYLEETPAGNIITGFESYTKGTGTTAPGGARRRGPISDANRVFSKSSISYNGVDSPAPSAVSTPVQSAPTPNALRSEGGSNHATPVSGSSANTKPIGVTKKNKKNGDDSETEGRDSKKARMSFGAARK